ncbi:hypothetical protein JRY13_12750 [Lacticaseibacillus paracasei]|uniref:hypothetical protein n=1 Tax=Lacticaseibacillus paracasei TaxID=1597 RepID=UPI0019504003|nr:hypothetical protein [Lacticaseibacillus paracasei]MBM6642092.1 hypothetical protein [Lacticaseibacillus paracasei]
MSNETKRDVVEAILLAKDTDTIWDSSTVRYYLNRYDAALPDDLPVIAEVASEYIKMQKNDKRSLYQSFKSFHTSEILTQYELFDQLENSSEQYALAWVLGVWRVEETGEIVKLEVEK